MNETQLPGEGGSRRQCSVLGDQRQRRVLSILLDRSRPMSVQDLAVRLAAHEADTAPSTVPEEDLRRMRIELHHRCLPVMEAAGVIERHPEGLIADEPRFFRNADISASELTEHDQRFWEAVGTILPSARRRAVMTIVADRRFPLTLEELAKELVDSSYATQPESRETHSSLVVKLYHVDLPKLAEIGVIEFDPEEKTVASTPRGVSIVDRLGLGDGNLEETGTC